MLWSHVITLACYMNLYMIKVGDTNDMECGVGRHWSLFATITPLLQSMECTYHGQVCVVVLGTHLVLLVLAALVMCVVISVALECTWCCQYLLHFSYVLALCVYCGAWSTWWSVLAAVLVCVGSMCV